MPVESILKKRKRLAYVVSHLKEEYPDSKCSLHYKTSFQLLVATILSAQCTDERVNKVAQNLFAKYPEAKDFATLPLETLKKAIYSTGFYNNKAKNIKTKYLLNEKIDTPIILSGGLNPDNILDAIDSVNPAAIDVNSGVELSHGKKDHQKINLLFENLKNTNTSGFHFG